MSATVQSKGKIIQATLALDTSIFAAGDQIGTIKELTNVLEGSSGTSILSSFTIVDKDKQAAVMQVLFFNDKPVVTSVENAALDISDAEMASKCLGVVSVVAADYFALNANSIATIKNIQMVLHGVKSADNPTGRSIWIITRSGGTPTYTASGLIYSLGLLEA